jgi:hypothetical protein
MRQPGTDLHAYRSHGTYRDLIDLEICDGIMDCSGLESFPFALPPLRHDATVAHIQLRGQIDDRFLQLVGLCRPSSSGSSRASWTSRTRRGIELCKVLTHLEFR